MAQTFIGVGVVPTFAENLNAKKAIKAEATKLRALDVLNDTDKRIYLHLYDKAKTTDVADGTTKPIMPPIPVGPYDSIHLGPELVGRDFTFGIIAQALTKPRATEYLNAAAWGVDVTFWTRSN